VCSVAEKFESDGNAAKESPLFLNHTRLTNFELGGVLAQIRVGQRCHPFGYATSCVVLWCRSFWGVDLGNANPSEMLCSVLGNLFNASRLGNRHLRLAECCHFA
jgi:hypothetical protein